jgi:hypothetical protein
VLPSLEHIGNVATGALTAVVAWVGFGWVVLGLLYTKCSELTREWTDQVTGVHDPIWWPDADLGGPGLRGRGEQIAR